jgi:hypothetical protein
VTLINPFLGTGRQRPVFGNEGRSSTTGRIVTVFGASGFLGRYITLLLGKAHRHGMLFKYPSFLIRLAKEGNTVIVAYNGEEDDVRHLRPTGDLGQILPMVPSRSRADNVSFPRGSIWNRRKKFWIVSGTRTLSSIVSLANMIPCNERRCPLLRCCDVLLLDDLTWSKLTLRVLQG